MSSDQERDAVDLLTNCMYSLGFLQSITEVIFSEQRDKITVGDFYDQWLLASGATGDKIPFNLGAIVSYLYCGLVMAKELWDNLVPNEPIGNVPVDWSLNEVIFSAPKQQNPSARYVLRRIRNSLGHGNIRVIVPNEIIDKSQIMQRVSVRFHDVNPGNPSDVFDAEATLGTLTRVIKKFHSEVHRYVREQ